MTTIDPARRAGLELLDRAAADFFATWARSENERPVLCLRQSASRR